TRCYRDWSSDVCSSDLSTKTVRDQVGKEQFDVTGSLVNGKKISLEGLESGNYMLTLTLAEPGSQQKAYSTVSFHVLSEPASLPEIGRASCRERVEMWVG